MDFELSEMNKDIQRLAKDVAEKKLLPTVKERDDEEKFDRSLVDDMG